MEGFFIFKINNNGKEENVVSFLPPNKVSELDGLHPLCIWGVATIAEDNKTIKSMINNSTFVEFMHEIIVKHAIKMPNVLEAAKQIGNGWVNIKDGREAEENDPNSNIIGSFKTENGIIQKEIYQKNPNYKLFNEKGLFSIHPYLFVF